MKKKILVGCILVSSLTFAATNLEGSFKQIEKEYETLIKKEATVYETKKSAAIQAQSELDKQKTMYLEVSAKQQQLQSVKDIRFYKAEYTNLINKLDTVLNKLEGEMNVQKTIINNFENIKKIKEGK